MKTKAWLVVLACSVVMCAEAAAGAASGALKEVEAVERARFKAWIAADVKAIRPMLADDVVYCHSTGQCQTKEELLATIVSGETVYQAMDVDYMKPRLVDGAVVINGKLSIKGSRKGVPTTFTAVYTDVYAKRDGHWQLVAWQTTRLP